MTTRRETRASVMTGSAFLRSKKDRRSSARLLNGSTRPCTKCGAVSEFRELYWMMHAGRSGPAWLCRNSRCGAGEFVRGI